ncbi:MAG: hypothetical protein VB050_09340 [Geobacteraceae bacterium]|nr:hypothetical protein [Geobacteraceae bacterium]
MKLSGYAKAGFSCIGLICLLVLSGVPAFAAGDYSKYVMDKQYFSCDIPSAWSLERTPEQDEDYRIYEIQLLAPKGGAFIYVSYYTKDNKDFWGYEDFLKRNSRNVAGETKNSRENYGPVKESGLNGRKAFELERDRLVFLHPESKSDESAAIRELFYVAPSSDGGFYVLHYSAPKALYDEYLPVLKRIASTFKGL